jgi:hypothetical protein
MGTRFKTPLHLENTMKILSQNQVNRMDSVDTHNALVKHDEIVILYHCGKSERCKSHTAIRDARYRIGVAMG